MSLIQSLQDILTCSDHPHLLNAPITLNCGHSTCSGPTSDELNLSTSSLPLSNRLVCPQPECDLSSSPTPVSSLEIAPATNVTLQKIISHLSDSCPSEIESASDNCNQVSLYRTILSELECSLCSLIFDCPTTTICGHTFCRTCLLRALDYSDRCPVCRSTMGAPLLRLFQSRSPDFIINKIIKTCFASETSQEPCTPFEVGSEQNKVPLFVCTLAFPKLPVFLHVFEPRYRLLIRRALSRDNKFGIVLPSLPQTENVDGVHPFGTLLEIQKIDFLPDGRSLILAYGLTRFEILRTEPLDGYSVAEVRWIEDVDKTTEDRLEIEAGPEESIESLSKICQAFVEVLRAGSTPWILQRLNNTFGPPPSDPAEFSYWMAMVLPMADDQKAQLLPITTIRLRLKLIVHWIRGFKTQWWFRGCVIF
ncbi:hypothetical protein CROQUDRAFT_668266 [Cronartium quercuum f. sp. fusiforme G11]|uniref:Uncharacterized protein n=1 Tax=Cronartium quercuum f. sp. fusiforme G11 TaxID=708437 RepID=A0A9P6NS06_9BASI|nr:hypothetical protein CROQUDRAFT_668266 [Cronartium quercuum f. sp. fusiforme G11]